MLHPAQDETLHGGQSKQAEAATLRRCWQHEEPVLLVGETGTGKTTVCQRLAHQLGCKLHIVNCNQHTEAADLLGGYRPARHALVLRVQISCAGSSGLLADCMASECATAAGWWWHHGHEQRALLEAWFSTAGLVQACGMFELWPRPVLSGSSCRNVQGVIDEFVAELAAAQQLCIAAGAAAQDWPELDEDLVGQGAKAAADEAHEAILRVTSGLQAANNSTHLHPAAGSLHF